MDNVGRAFYQIIFERDFLKKKGTEFQEFFSQIMERAYPGDFQRIRAYGNIGDYKCDGYMFSTQNVFQAYAPLTLKLSDLLDKIEEDYDGACKAWKDRIKVWTFVHNQREGLPAPAQQKLNDLRQAEIPGEPWGYLQLLGIVCSLPEDQLITLFGVAPSFGNFTALQFTDLSPVLDQLTKIEYSNDVDFRPVFRRETISQRIV